MKTEIKSELLLASNNSATGDILYTFRLTYPRMILAEILTHRVFSRNTSSTRAIPTLKMILAIIRDMFVPVYIGAAQKGMQAGAELTGWRRKAAVAVWMAAGYTAAFWSYLLYLLGVAKQIAGRVVEPYSWTIQIASMTEIDNFLALRNHYMAEPHLHQLARQMKKQVEFAKVEFNLMAKSGCNKVYNGRYEVLQPGEWHLPLVDQVGSIEDRKMISAARCARTSYTLLETGSIPDAAKDIELCQKLFGGRHYSPFEHQAQAMETSEFSANFKGFKQYRKEVEDDKN